MSCDLLRHPPWNGIHTPQGMDFFCVGLVSGCGHFLFVFLCAQWRTKFSGLVELNACVPALAVFCGYLISRESNSEKEKRGNRLSNESLFSQCCGYSFTIEQLQHLSQNE